MDFTFFFVAVIISRERLVVRRNFSSFMSPFQSRIACRNLPYQGLIIGSGVASKHRWLFLLEWSDELNPDCTVKLELPELLLLISVKFIDNKRITRSIPRSSHPVIVRKRAILKLRSWTAACRLDAECWLCIYCKLQTRYKNADRDQNCIFVIFAYVTLPLTMSRNRFSNCYLILSWYNAIIFSVCAQVVFSFVSYFFLFSVHFHSHFVKYKNTFTSPLSSIKIS